jgi:hypothetical protein
MGTYRLYLDEPCEGKVGRGVRYNYEDEVLEIDFYGDKAWHHVPRRSGVSIVCRGSMPELVRLEPPYGYRQKLMWLCGVPKDRRTVCRADFDALVERERSTGATTRSFGGAGWEITWAKMPDGKQGGRGKGEYIAAAWVDSRIRGKNIRKMLEAAKMDVPDWYITKVLTETGEGD